MSPSYLEATEQKLGFNQIRQIIVDLCQGEVGKKMAGQLRFSKNFETVARHQQQVAEGMRMLAAGISFPTCHLADLQPYAEQLEIEDFVLMADQWMVLSKGMKLIEQLCKSLRRNASSYPTLARLSEKVEIPAEIFYRLDQIFDQDGMVKDSASPELNRLRKQKIDVQSRLRRKLESSLKNAVNLGMIHPDAALTLRNGRMVIPILAEFKRKIKGFIHDESATGQTVYIEPEEALDANNELRELHFAENREITRILAELTKFLRPHRKQVGLGNQLIGIIDLIQAKTTFGHRLQAISPDYQPVSGIHFSQARHPLLQMAHQQSQKPIVPLDIWLDASKPVLVISGPNAGGKSICLKTVGLLQMMWQAGIPIPVGEGTRMGHFEKIMVDIGDQQSIENDLSTYSSHLSHMSLMLKEANSQTLLLLDEFGAGTDPALGGPIAEAILEGLCHKKVFAVVNTHYSNLKTFAHKHPLIENGCMKFDVEKMVPLYELEIGRPGSSYALEIAEKIGLPKAILNQAKQKIGVKKVQMDKLLTELEEEKVKLKARNQELQDNLKSTKLLQAETEKKYKELESNRKKILNDAKAKGAQLISEANRKIEEVIRTIRESQAEKSTTRLARLELEKAATPLLPEPIEEVLPEPGPQKSVEIKVVNEPIQLSDFVRIKGTHSIGTVVGFRGKDAEVLIGEIKTNIRTDKLEKVSSLGESAEVAPKAKKMGNLDLNAKMMQFSQELDVRGLRADEALAAVDNWLDQAILLGQKDIRILHGKGDGILRTQIRNRLRQYKQVGRLSDEHADRGGAGVTLVALDI